MEFDAEILARWLPITEAVPVGKAREAADSAFAPTAEHREEAPTLDRVLALLGRSAGWPNSAG